MVALAESADGRTLVSADARSIRVGPPDAAEGEPLLRRPDGDPRPIQDVAIDGDTGTVFIAIEGDPGYAPPSLEAWSLAKRESLPAVEMATHYALIDPPRLAPAPGRLFVGAFEAMGKVGWISIHGYEFRDPRRSEPRLALLPGGKGWNVHPSPQAGVLGAGSTLAIYGAVDCVPAIWDLARGAFVRAPPLPGTHPPCPSEQLSADAPRAGLRGCLRPRRGARAWIGDRGARPGPPRLCRCPPASKTARSPPVGPPPAITTACFATAGFASCRSDVISDDAIQASVKIDSSLYTFILAGYDPIMFTGVNRLPSPAAPESPPRPAAPESPARPVLATTLALPVGRAFLRPPAVATHAGAWQRLVNLGHADTSGGAHGHEARSAKDLARATFVFQIDQRIRATGVLDGETARALVNVHDLGHDLRPDRGRLEPPRILPPGALSTKSRT